MTITEEVKKSKEPYSRTNPYPAKVLKVCRLNDEQSSKEVLHVELDLTDSDFSYLPGDSFGIYPKNAPDSVSAILEVLNFETQPETQPEIQDKKSGKISLLRTYLSEKACLSKVTKRLLTLIQKYTLSPPLEEILVDRTKLMTFIEHNNVFTTLQSFWSNTIPAQELCDNLCTLLPRYYSVASSRAKVGNKVELMVASFNYLEAENIKRSVTATFLKCHCLEGTSVLDTFVQDNNKFRLPEDPSTPIILIGPGTGIAALRGFLHERIATEATGENWLFTGDREQAYDFHYRTDLLAWKANDQLRLDLAFSRDGTEKVYVQNKMIQQSKDLFDWIHNKNASIYICGDAKRMAKDVQKALVEIVIKEYHKSEEDAKAYIKDLKKQKRLLLDVY